MEAFNRIIALVFIIGPLLFMTGCGYSKEERMGSGAVTGAAIGGVTGLLCCGDPINGMAVGVIGGALVGGAVGYFLDEPLMMDHRADMPHRSPEQMMKAPQSQSAPPPPPQPQAAPVQYYPPQAYAPTPNPYYYPLEPLPQPQAAPRQTPAEQPY